MSKTPRSSVGLSSLASTAANIAGQTLVVGRHYLIDFSSATVNLPAGSAGAVIQVTPFGNLTNTYRLTVSAANAGQKIYYDGMLYDQLLISPTDYSLSFAWDDSGATGHWVGVDWPAQDASIDLSADVNLCLNPSDALAGWSYSGGGSATTDTATVPLGPAVQTSIRISGSASGDYALYRWTMPSAMLNRKLAIEWWQVGSTLTSGDFKVELYTNTSSFYSGSYTELSLSTDDTNGLSAIPNMNGLYRTSFDAGSDLYYELRITRTTSGFKALYVAGVQIGHRGVLQGAAVSEWIAFTPTTAGYTGKTFTNTGRWRRVGASMEYQFYLSTDSAVGAGATGVTVSIPTGYNIDVTALQDPSSVTSAGNMVGYWDGYAVLVASQLTRMGRVYPASATTLRFGMDNDADVVLLGSDLSGARLMSIQGRVTVPIAEWAGSGTVNVVQNDVEYAWNAAAAGGTGSDTTSFGYGPEGGYFPGTLSDVVQRRAQFQTPIQPTDMLVLEVKDVQGRWIQFDNLSGGGSNNIPIRQWDWITGFTSTGSVGIGIKTGAPVGSCDVILGRYYWASLDGTSPQNWADWSGSKWRVRKISGGQAVGFGLASATSAGLVPRYAEGSFTFYVDDGTTNSGVAKTAYYVRNGSMVIINFPQAVMSTAATTALYLTTSASNATYTWPSILTPVRTTGAVVVARDNGNNTPGTFKVEYNGGVGKVTIYKDLNQGPYAVGTANKGIDGFVVTYNILP